MYKIFPLVIQVGMNIEQFLDGDIRLLHSYITAYVRNQRRKNNNMDFLAWKIGKYNCDLERSKSPKDSKTYPNCPDTMCIVPPKNTPNISVEQSFNSFMLGLKQRGLKIKEVK